MSTTVHRNPASAGLPPVPAPRHSGDARPATIGILSTYPPTQCGLATFSAALTEQLNRAPGSAGVVRIVDRPESHAGAEVATHVVNGSPSSVAAAVCRLNRRAVGPTQHLQLRGIAAVRDARRGRGPGGDAELRSHQDPGWSSRLLRLREHQGPGCDVAATVAANVRIM